MASPRVLTDCSNSFRAPLDPSLHSHSSAILRRHFRASTPATSRRLSQRLVVAASLSRRRLIAESAAAASLSPLVGLCPARAADEPLSEWERVYLPIDPGVVLLDIAFVPDDPNHGPF